MSMERMKSRVKNKKFISFDIYDTLIKRDVMDPSDVFTITERVFNNYHHETVRNFNEIRKNAEEKARKYYQREITLCEIYSFIVGQKLQRKQGKEITISERIATVFKNYELETEREISCINQPIYDLFQYCKEENKIIFIITDMYLPQDFIMQLLENHKIIGYEKLYVSSEIKKTKADGTLFRHILNEQKLNVSEWLHIGDSKIGDWISPEKQGIRTYNIPRYLHNCRYLNLNAKLLEMDYKILYTFINNRIEKMENHIQKIGYEIYGPLLYFFTRWLIQELCLEKTVLLFARDCYIVEKALNILEEYPLDKHYFRASRRSLMVPILREDASMNIVINLIKSASAKFTVKDFFELVGLQIQDHMDILNKYCYKTNDILDRDSLLVDEKFISFYSELEGFIRENAEREYEGFCIYWKTLNTTEDIQVVDIGWRCTMQKCLEDLQAAKLIKGFYFGVREDSIANRENIKGYFLNGEDNLDIKIMLAGFTSIFEIFFTEPCNSVKCYGKDGTIQYFQNRWEDEQQKQYNNNIIYNLHKGAIEFVNDFHKSYVKKYVGDNRWLGVWGIKQLGSNPLGIDLALLGDFSFHTGTKVIPVALPKCMLYYIVHPKQYLLDFSESSWKIGFLKRTFHIKLPYEKIFKWIYCYRRNRRSHGDTTVS